MKSKSSLKNSIIIKDYQNEKKEKKNLILHTCFIEYEVHKDIKLYKDVCHVFGETVVKDFIKEHCELINLEKIDRLNNNDEEYESDEIYYEESDSDIEWDEEDYSCRFASRNVFYNSLTNYKLKNLMKKKNLSTKSGKKNKEDLVKALINDLKENSINDNL